jgi:hypothetical protein
MICGEGEYDVVSHGKTFASLESATSIREIDEDRCRFAYRRIRVDVDRDRGSDCDSMILAPLVALVERAGDQQPPDLGIGRQADEQMQTGPSESAAHRGGVFLDRDDSERSARDCLGGATATDALDATRCDNEEIARRGDLGGNVRATHSIVGEAFGFEYGGDLVEFAVVDQQNARRRGRGGRRHLDLRSEPTR